MCDSRTFESGTEVAEFDLKPQLAKFSTLHRFKHLLDWRLNAFLHPQTHHDVATTFALLLRINMIGIILTIPHDTSNP